MSSLYFMTIICDRNQTRRFLAFYKEHGVSVTFQALGRGTAASEILDSFGLEASEKAMLFSVVTDSEWRELKRGLETQIKIDIPLHRPQLPPQHHPEGGGRQLQFLIEGREFKKGEESALKDTKYELLVVIANQGYTEMIMEAARKASATGGTVLHAKGTGMEKAETFLGVSLAQEKEMIFLVVKKEAKNPIMRAVMEEAGLNSKAKSIVFSLPVTETAGMRLIEDTI